MNEGFEFNFDTVELKKMDGFLDLLVILLNFVRKIKLKIEVDLENRSITILDIAKKQAFNRMLLLNLKQLKRSNGSRVSFEQVGEDVEIKLNYTYIVNSLRDEVRKEFIDNGAIVKMEDKVIIAKPTQHVVAKDDAQELVDADQVKSLNKLLYDAILDGDLVDVKKALTLGADINNIDNDEDESPLMMSMDKNQLEISEYLIKNGADVNKVTNGWKPLELATEYALTDVIDMLIKHGAK